MAAALLVRRIDGVAIDLDGGHAAIASLNSLDTIPDAVTLEQVLDDLTVWLVGNEGINRCLHRPPSMIDEDRAHDLAHKVTADPDEGAALVHLGRMRARTLATSPAFIALVQPVADALLERGSLDGDEVAAILNDNGGQANGKA